MRAFPLQRLRIGFGIGEPQARAVVMGIGQTVALGQKGQTLYRRGRFACADLALAVARGDVLAGRPCHSAGRRGGEGVDPAALLVAQFIDAAIGQRADDAAIFPACQYLVMPDMGHQNCRVSMRTGAGQPVLFDKYDLSVRQSQNRLRADKATAQDMLADINRHHMGGQAGMGSGTHARVASTAFSIIARSSLRPINTILDWRNSSGFQSRCRSPSRIMCTP